MSAINQNEGAAMERDMLISLLPTMPMILEELTEAGWNCEAYIKDETTVYRGIRLYHGQKKLESDMLYLLRPEEAEFPSDQYSYISTASIPGLANHFICSNRADEVILDDLLELFSKYQQWEQSMDQLTYRNASIQELCDLGARLLDNPVCIHDDWFMMIAMSQGLDEVMAPEYVTSSSMGFIPRAIVDDFKYDSEYLETYVYRNAQVWHGDNGAPDSMYVNLWDGAVYRGRLLIVRHNRDFRKSDFLLAEVFAQRVMYLLNRKQPGERTQARSMDDIIFDLLQNRQTDPADLTQLMNLLNWNKHDHFLCIRIKNQQEDVTSVMDHVLHSDLFHVFSGGYILYAGHEQCVVLNLTKEPMRLDHIRHLLAPLCRDYCLYAGISSPVTDIRDLHLAYYQADVALKSAFKLRSEKWIIPFSAYAMEYIFTSLNSPLQTGHLAAPALHALAAYDKEKGTPYFETLRTYLLEERDIPRTAQKLIIHRTTLLYRLKKINQMIPDDLNDPWTRLYYLLSLWMLEQEVT